MKIRNKILYLIVVCIFFILVLVASTYAYIKINKINIGSFNVKVRTDDIDIFKIIPLKDANIEANDSNFGPNNGVNQTSAAEIKVSLETTKKTTKYCYNVNVVFPPQAYMDLTEKVKNMYQDNTITSNETLIMDEFDSKVCNFSGNQNLSNDLTKVLCSIDSLKGNVIDCSNTILYLTEEISNSLSNTYCTSVFNYSTLEKTPELVLNLYSSNDGKNYIKIVNNYDITTSIGKYYVPTTSGGNIYKHEIIAQKGKKVEKYYKAEVTFVWLKDVFQKVNGDKKYQAHLEVNLIDC